MLRRQIIVNGQKTGTRIEKRNEVKERLRNQFHGNTDQVIDQMVEFLLMKGYTEADMASTALQSQGGEMPAVQAFLFHNEHILDQVRLNQGTYTHFQDTRRDPNFALRMTGESELLFRRLTPADLIMLNAAQLMSARLGENDRPADQLPNYWERVFTHVFTQVLSDANRYQHAQMLADPAKAAATAIAFVCNAPEATEYSIKTTFHTPWTRFYVGTQWLKENRRGPEGYNYGYSFTTIEEPTESLWMTATVLICYGIDSYARYVMQGERTMDVSENFTTPFQNHMSRYGIAAVFKTEDAPNGDQGPQDQTRPEPSFGSYVPPRGGW
jgi:hypothetical protein